MFFDDVGDAEKAHLMYARSAYCLASKPRPEFVETFGIALVEKMLAGGWSCHHDSDGWYSKAVGDHALFVRPDTEIAAAIVDATMQPMERWNMPKRHKNSRNVLTAVNS